MTDTEESFNINFFSVVVIQFILLVCVFVYAFYHVLNYAHTNDTKFGASLFARIFVISGEIIYLFVICYVPVDVELSTRGENAFNVSEWIWLIFGFIQMFYIWVFSPILFAFYDTDERKSYCKRLWDAIRI